MPTTPTALSTRLEEHRSRFKLSYRDIGRRLYDRGLDYCEGAVSAWFAGRRVPPVGTLAALCDLFELSDRERGALLRAASTPSTTAAPAPAPSRRSRPAA